MSPKGNQQYPQYSVTCLCGHLVTGPTLNLTCPSCGLAIAAEWPCVTRLQLDGSEVRL